jgi:hypothetical protein
LKKRFFMTPPYVPGGVFPGHSNVAIFFECRELPELVRHSWEKLFFCNLFSAAGILDPNADGFCRPSWR